MKPSDTVYVDVGRLLLNGPGSSNLPRQHVRGAWLFPTYVNGKPVGVERGFTRCKRLIYDEGRIVRHALTGVRRDVAEAIGLPECKRCAS